MALSSLPQTACVLQIITFLDMYIETNSLAIAATNLTSFTQPLSWPIIDISSCALGGPSADTSYSVDGGLGRDDVVIDYNNNFYSYAGCRCLPGFDNVYTFDATGSSGDAFLQSCSVLHEPST